MKKKYYLYIKLKTTNKTKVMYTLSDLSEDARFEFNNDFESKKFTTLQNGYSLKCYSKNGLRCFVANRVCVASDKLNMAFGGGSFWKLSYYEVSYKIRRDLSGDLYAELCFGKKFAKTANGVEIPQYVNTKHEVLEIASKIGIFNL